MSPRPRLRGAAPPTLRGSCRRCGVEHVVDNDAVAIDVLQALFDDLDGERPPTTDAVRDREVLLATRGKMLAVLVVVDEHGQRHVLRAYSGDLGGVLDRAGWAPSIIRREHTADLEAQTLATVASLTAQLNDARDRGDDVERERCRVLRKQASATLMAAMHDAVRLTSAAGVTVPLRQAFVGDGIPSGTADCGLPKLLHLANTQRLRVVGAAEAWWGPDLGDRRHGVLQAPCDTKCAPILGHLLCPVPA